MSIQETLTDTTTRTTRIESTLIDIGGQNSLKWSFPNIRFIVAPKVLVYERDIGDGIISAHPNAKHGSARGESATTYGSWTKIAESSQGELVRGGRASIVDVLAGNAGAFTEAAVGQGTTLPSVDDESLVDLNKRSPASTERIRQGVSRTRSIFLFYQHQGEITEFGVFDDEGRMVARLTIDKLTPSLEKDIRVDVELEYTGNSSGGGVVTNQAENAVADSVARLGTSIGLTQFALGKGDTSPQKTDTSLDEEVITKDAVRQVTPESVGVESVFLESEPASQPVTITETGVFDSEDRLIWRTLMEDVEKTEDVIIQSLAVFRVV